jgi:DNA polymerase-3 subunit alpha
MSMAMITLEDLDGQIDGVLFAETLADITKRYPESVSLERIVFLRGKIDRRRETPSLMVNDLIPIEEAIPKLTTSLGLKLDPSRHTPALTAELDPLLRRHKGNTEVYLQIAASLTTRVVMKLDRDRYVKPSADLKAELSHLLGGDCVQFSGVGTRRKKKQAQQALFKEEALEPTAPEAATRAEVMKVDAEMEMVEDMD